MAMKNLFICLLITAFGITEQVQAQGCIPDTLILSRQGQIDSFAINYPGCHKILGTLIIQEANSGEITRLQGLSQLDSILGGLHIGSWDWAKGCIGSNSSLSNLNGLNRLSA